MLFPEPGPEHKKVLREKFKLQNFKKDQWTLIRSLIYDRKDCFVIATTGFGKSLIYQYPAVFTGKLAVVISPLCSLMQDQVLSLTQRNIKACFLGSMQPDKRLRLEDFNIVFITPEFLKLHPKVLKNVEDKIMLFAIDEAHVIFQWSDFRENYAKLDVLRKTFPSVPIIALTATAPSYVQDVIKTSLMLREDLVEVQTPLDRPNLQFEIRGKTNFINDILPLLRDLKEGSAIVYCPRKADTENYSQMLNDNGIQSRPYHSEVKPKIREQIVRDFKNHKLRFVVCTIAYGMGVDTPDVRLVLHYGAPKSIEAYYQEAGRAGRDGKPSKCVMFNSVRDYDILYFFLRSDHHASEEKKAQLEGLIERFRSFVGSKMCRRYEVLEYLGATEEELATFTIRPDCCDNCRKALCEKIDKRLVFVGINEAGQFDFSEDTRILLKGVHRKIAKNEIIDMIRGVPPNRNNFRHYKLEAFGSGTKKPEQYWKLLMDKLISLKYFKLVRSRLRLNKKSIEFLKYKKTTLQFPPSPSLCEYLEKKDEFEFFWENGEIRHRVKVVEVSSILDEELLSECEIIEANAEVKQSPKISEFCSTQDYLEDEILLKECKIIEANETLRRNLSWTYVDSDSDVDLSMIEEAEKAEKSRKNPRSSDDLNRISQLENERDRCCEKRDQLNEEIGRLNEEINYLKRKYQDDEAGTSTTKRARKDEGEKSGIPKKLPPLL